jgi:hypothetical protein
MNERIKELAEQAGMVNILDEHASEYGNGMFENTPYPELEKFAELIVRECAQVCLEQRDPANLNYKPSEKFAEAVKQHFGVEK